MSPSYWLAKGEFFKLVNSLFALATACVGFIPVTTSFKFTPAVLAHVSKSSSYWFCKVSNPLFEYDWRVSFSITPTSVLPFISEGKFKPSVISASSSFSLLA